MPNPSVTVLGLVERAAQLARAHQRMHAEAHSAIDRNPPESRQPTAATPQPEKDKPK